MATPHRVIDSIADGVLAGARNLANAGAGALRGAGGAVMTGLDKPFSSVTGKEGPHRIADRLANGALDTVMNFVNNGVLGSVDKAGETVMRALDQPPEQTGIPPDLEKMGEFGLFKK